MTAESWDSAYHFGLETYAPDDLTANPGDW